MKRHLLLFFLALGFAVAVEEKLPRPDFSLFGWAAENGGTTGGAGGPSVEVRTLEDLKREVRRNGPRIIKIVGTILGSESVVVLSNKTIIGVGSDARLVGCGLLLGTNSRFGQVRNVIIRNLTFEKPVNKIDKIAIAYGTTNVWVDHCEFFSDRDHGIDFYDGQVDITHGSAFVTVSWCRFRDHYKNSLVGHSDKNAEQDTSKLTVSYHHNHFVRVDGRNPSVRWGRVHVYNNFYEDIGDYGVAARDNAEIVVENNFFRKVPIPIRADTSLSKIAGKVSGVSTNIFEKCGDSHITTEPSEWKPPYKYTLDRAADVPALIEKYAGPGVELN